MVFWVRDNNLTIGPFSICLKQTQCFDSLGGVFITWRQKDPKEADLGLYGKKNAYSKSIDIIDYDIYLEDIHDDMKHDTNQTHIIAKAKFKRTNIAHNETVLNSIWTHELSKFFS